MTTTVRVPCGGLLTDGVFIIGNSPSSTNKLLHDSESFQDSSWFPQGNSGWRTCQRTVRGNMDQVFPDLLDDYALLYGDLVKSGQPWKWEDLPFGDQLSHAQRKLIQDRAAKLGYTPHMDNPPPDPSAHNQPGGEATPGHEPVPKTHPQGEPSLNPAHDPAGVPDAGVVTHPGDTVFPATTRGVPTQDQVMPLVKFTDTGHLTTESIRDIANLATMNPDADTVILGKWYADSPNSYEQIAYQANATYYDLGDAYHAIRDQLPADWTPQQVKDEMWRINQQFIDNQIDQGKEFIFTSNPEDFRKDSFGWREYQRIKENPHYSLEYDPVNNQWKMVR